MRKEQRVNDWLLDVYLGVLFGFLGVVCLVGGWGCLFWVLLWVLGVGCPCESGVFVGFLPTLDCYSLSLGPCRHMIAEACCFPLWIFSSPA